jgi:uncharacterized protein YndB with AHSA1/START domain
MIVLGALAVPALLGGLALAQQLDTTGARMRAAGTFEVQVTPQPVDGTPFSGARLKKVYAGGLVGSGEGYLVGSESEDGASGGYVALEVVSGTLEGRHGGFVLQHIGHTAAGQMQMTAQVIPGSGTGDLAGIAGTLTITFVKGAHAYTLEYTVNNDLPGPAEVTVVKSGNRHTVMTGTFPVDTRTLFAALTVPDQLQQWMHAEGMRLMSVAIEPREGGRLRYEYQRPNGRTMAVLGVYRAFEPPARFAYAESYDFSPLKIEVTTQLDALEPGLTRLTQTLEYGSEAERDEDFEGVATSSREAFGRLAQFLVGR